MSRSKRHISHAGVNIRTIAGTEQVALVTGGSRGLGAALVARLLQQGYAVATLSRTRTEFIEQMLRQRSKYFCWSSVDASDHYALLAFVKDVSHRFGRIDVLINNLGVAIEGVLPTMRTYDIVTAVNVNLVGALILVQGCSRIMLRQGAGCIVNVSSVNAIRGNAGVTVYSATKAALDGLTRSLARELGPRNIRVNSVAPGYFNSEMAKNLSEEHRQRILRRTPLGRIAETDDIVNAVQFLISEQSSFITGQTLVVDGGITC
jgi:3-oxoacyl-[acyl-carrier protein] reductase